MEAILINTDFTLESKYLWHVELYLLDTHVYYITLLLFHFDSIIYKRQHSPYKIILLIEK